MWLIFGMLLTMATGSSVFGDACGCRHRRRFGHDRFLGGRWSADGGWSRRRVGVSFGYQYQSPDRSSLSVELPVAGLAAAMFCFRFLLIDQRIEHAVAGDGCG